MKQVLQSLRSGMTELVEIPCPQSKAGHLLVYTCVSLVSAGTERTLVEFGKANLLDKARQQPEKVHMVLDKIRTDGLVPTLEAVRSKLDQPLPMGYCNVGVVLEVGTGVSGFAVGDRVVSNGPHAEMVCVPQNLCAKVPENVSDEAAAFTVLGAIGLQGMRLAQPNLGEVFVVTGLGLIGLITAQLLRAHGCRVLGIDVVADRLALAGQLGIETVNLSQGDDPVATALAFSRGRGVDGVLITASTHSNEPIHQAALLCRTRGRIVLVGAVGLELSRTDFYEKELSFQVSCSYGPGRYDPEYEEKGHDYPVGYVRWTEQRNFEAVLDMLADGRLEVLPLISHRFPLAQAEEAYALLSGSSPYLGILLQYSAQEGDRSIALRSRTIALQNALPSPPSSIRGEGEKPVVGVIGAGNYAIQVLLPALRKTGVRLKAVASSGGVSSVHAGRKFGFQEATTDTNRLLADPEINTIVITTRHDSHARFVCQALRAGKHVFVEKPLALTHAELEEIESLYATLRNSRPCPILMVGFNRRFAPQIQKITGLLKGVHEPKVFVMTVNAGAVPPEHWTQNPLIGGGRIIGEGCHFIDLLRFLAGHAIVDVQVTTLGALHEGTVREDKSSFTLVFADGSFGTVHYLANGHKSFPKERLEVFCAGRVLQLDNFRRLRGYGWSGFRKMSLWRQDKGHAACVTAFVEAVRQGKPSPIPFEELVGVTRISFKVVESASQTSVGKSLGGWDSGERDKTWS